MQFTATVNPNGVVIDGSHSLSTLLIVSDKEKSVTRGSILTALSAKGIDPLRISAIAPTRQFNHWIVVAKDQGTFDLILEAGVTEVSSRPADITTFSNKVLFGRIIYLPPQLDDETPVEFLNRFGVVKKFWRETCAEESCKHLETGVRSFVMEPHDSVSSDGIPQTACLGGTEVLIRIRGQQPRCFGCNLAGHQRRDCSQRQPPPARGKEKKTETAKGNPGTKLPEPTPAPPGTPAATPAPQPASPRKLLPPPPTPPAKAVTRQEETTKKQKKAPVQNKEDSDDDPYEEALVQKAIVLLPGSLRKWGEEFFVQYSDQTIAKMKRIKHKLTGDAFDAMWSWIEYHEQKRISSLPAARN